jgi:SAM-dependent methyltransferase
VRLVTDAHLAGIAIVHGLELSSRDRDFARRSDLGFRSRDAAFDTMVCTFELCSTPAIDPVIAERRQVLRPGGRFVLVDHVASTKTVLAPRDLTDLPHRFAVVGALQLSAAEAEQ